MTRRSQRLPLVISSIFAVCAVGLSSCGELSMDEERALARLERLVFVPAAACTLGPSGLPTPAGFDCSNEAPLLVDRYEVTRAEWSGFLARRGHPAAGLGESKWAEWGSAGGTLPATYMDRAEASEFAESEGMRIPSRREWLRISAGTRAQRWPWGTSSARSVANTMELGLHSALGVGTFEAGATPSGVYDLVGNAREWTASDEDVEGQGSLANAMGGSWLSHQRPLFEWDPKQGLITNSLEVSPSHRAVDLGVRLVAHAEEYLRAESMKWGESPEARARVRAVGERWGGVAVELLSELATEDSTGVQWLLEGAQG